MKKFLSCPVAVIVMTCCLLLSCSKKEDSSLNIPDTPVLKSSAEFVVSPSGNYNDDSQAIQTALDNAVAAGQGNTVRLTAGTFYLKYKIEIDGFDGYFKGAGKQNTILTTHDPIDYNEGPLADNFCLITFRHGYVRMSDLTFIITEPEPCISDFENALPTLIGVAGSPLSDPPAGDQCGSSIFDNIEFICGAGNWYGYNVGGFVNISADRTEYIIGGNQKITRCLFQGSVNSLTNWGDNNSKWVVGGNAASGNTFKDAYWPLTLGEFCNSNAEISYNTFEDIYWGPIYITQGIFADPSNKSLSTFLIQHNIMDINEECDGISIIDYSNFMGYGKTIDAVIKNNQISMNIEGYFGGIFGLAGDDIIVKNNQMWGSCMAGIYSGVNGDLSDHWFIQGNNVQGVNALAAPVWLGEGTSNCVVIGGANKTNVFDQGTGNILTGVTKIHGNDLGQQAKEAHALRLEIMKMVKNH